MKRALVIGLALLAAIALVEGAIASPLVTVVDDLGRTVAVTSSERIVSIGPSCTEILYALGLGDRVIAVDKYSDYPPEAVAKQKISRVYMPDPEEVAALKPDLVVYYHWGPWDPTVERLSELGLTVIALAPRTLEDVIKDVRLIGNATGKLREAEALASSLSQRIEEVKNRVSGVAARPRVYIETWYPPPWTFGPGTWGHQLIELAGGVNAFGDAVVQWVQTTDEEVIARNPDVIVSLYGAMHYATLEDFRRRPGWDRIAAVSRGAVYLLDENLFVRPGPRIVDGLELLAKVLHPELFGESYTFLLDKALLEVGVQSLRASNVNISVIKVASSCTLAVTLSQAGPSAPKGKALIGSYVDVGCSAPRGLVFALRIPYDRDLLQRLGVSEGSLKICVWEGGRGWTALDTAVNREARYAEAVATRPGCFALLGEVAPVSPWEQPVPLWLLVASAVVAAAVAASATYAALERAKVSR